MIYQIIDAKKAEHKIGVSCKLMGVSASGYFAWRKRGCERRRLCRDQVALAHVRERFCLSGETYGAPRIWHDLKEDNIRIGRNRIARLMRENDLKAHPKRRFKKTTDSEHNGRIAANLLAQDFYGRRIYPISGPPRVGFISLLLLIFSRAELLAGR